MTTHTEKDFEQMMNNTCKLADIAGFKYEAGYALRLVDYQQFRELYLYWLDNAGIKGDFPEIDFDALSERLEDPTLVRFDELKDVVLADSNGWDDVAVVLKDGDVVHIIDSTNLDEYEFDDQSGLYVSPYGPEMCAGCVDYIIYNYDFKTHTWKEFDSALFEYYPGDTLESFFIRNQVI